MKAMVTFVSIKVWNWSADEAPAFVFLNATYDVLANGKFVRFDYEFGARIIASDSIREIVIEDVVLEKADA